MAERGSRARILQAAAEVAMEAGAGHMSLDAVAAKAGLSKGGLLYNFPNKAALLRALVEHYLVEFSAKLDKAQEGLASRQNCTALAYLAAFAEEADAKDRRAEGGGILAAIADDLTLLDPVRNFSRTLVDRMASDADPVAGMIAFLTVEGLRSTHLLETEVLTAEQKKAVLARLNEMLGA